MPRTHPLLQPYKPAEGDLFDEVKAAHLLNRATFGGTAYEVDRVIEQGPTRAIDALLDFPAAGAAEESADGEPDLSSIEGFPRGFKDLAKQFVGKTKEERDALKNQFQMGNREAVAATADWWVRRMATGTYPMQEKLTLFWHGHFTTSARDERAASLMWRQNELLRQFSTGNYREFIRQISRDPAMLDYLNNNQNKKEHPNENYARELMELFTLGIGNYTEDDIKQAARALTGWGHDGEGFVFRKREHDDGQKVFFGRKGNFDGDDVIDIILSTPASSTYIASRLFKFFVYEDIEPGLAEALGDVLRSNNWELRPMLQTMFTSKAFYSERAIGTQIKSPIQLIVSTSRLLDVDLPPFGRLHPALQQMGQVPLNPPNVKGWPGGRQWINTSTLFVRYNTAMMLAGGNAVTGQQRDKAFGIRGGRQGKRGRRGEDAVAFSPSEGNNDPKLLVDDWLERLIQRPVAEEKKTILLEAVTDKPKPETIRRMVQLIVSMPEYQLC